MQEPAFEENSFMELQIRRDILKDICLELERQLFAIDIEIIARGLAHEETRQ